MWYVTGANWVFGADTEWKLWCAEKNKWKMIAAILNHGCSLTGRATRRWQASRVGALSVWVCLDWMNKLDSSISNLILLPWSNFMTFLNYYLTFFFFLFASHAFGYAFCFLAGQRDFKKYLLLWLRKPQSIILCEPISPVFSSVWDNSSHESLEQAMFQIKKDSHFTVFCCITETDLRINAISSIFSFSNQPGGFLDFLGHFYSVWI